MNQDIDIVKYNSEGIDALKMFLSKLGSSSEKFRYFNKRTLDVIKNHLITILMKIDGQPVAYGHIDMEKDRYWLGIAVIPDFQGKGLGNKIMKELIERAARKGISEVFLSVDKENNEAIGLYLKFGFKEYLEKDDYYIFKKVMS